MLPIKKIASDRKMPLSIKKKRICITIAKTALAACLLSWLLWHSDLTQIRGIFSKISLWTIAIGIVLNVTATIISTYKWQLFLPEANFVRLFIAGMIGRFYSLVLPGQIAGELMKVFRVKEYHHRKEQLAISIIADKFTGILAVVFVGCAGMVIGYRRIPAGVIILCVIAATVAAMMACMIFSSKLLAVSEEFINRSCFPVKINKSLHKLISGWKILAMNLLLFLSSFGMGILFHLLSVAMIFVFAQDADLPISLIDLFWVMALVNIIGMFPITIAGLGVREGVFVGTLKWLNIGTESALFLSFILFGMQLIDAIIGFVFEASASGTKSTFIPNCQDQSAESSESTLES
jgi:uncharacterized protein (TIRG00374 family)